MARFHNFGAGPSALPLEVLERIREELLDFRGAGCSILEMSHRNKAFDRVITETEAGIRSLLAVPDNYEVIFCQGGGHQQFSAVPLNLGAKDRPGCYIVNGRWSQKAEAEAGRLISTARAATAQSGSVPSESEIKIPENAGYVYHCDNETVDGTEFPYIPETGCVPLVADMSSNIFSRTFDVAKYGAVWFGAQKNFGIAGLSIAIIRRDLVGRAPANCPVLLDWKSYTAKRSMLNTPPTFAIYVSGLVAEWIASQGGVAEMARRAAEKSSLVYGAVDASGGFYKGTAEPGARSRMNATFTLASRPLTEAFVKEAADEGLRNLKGHRSVGGVRASLYNAVPVEAARELASFMKEFERRHG